MSSPFLCDNYGRKVAFALSIAFMTLAGAMQMLASFTPYSEVLIAGRLIAAVFSPLSDAALILYLQVIRSYKNCSFIFIFQEISPSSLRGTMSSLYSTGYSTMCLLGMLLGHEGLLGHSLSVLLFVPVIPGILSTAFILWMPDTPKFLLLVKKDKVAALKSLRFFQGSLPDQTLLIDSMEHHHKEDANNNNNSEEKADSATSVMHILKKPHLRKAMMLSVSAAILTLPFYPILQNSTFFFTDMGVDM